MQPPYSDILYASKYRHNFPPHEPVERINSDQASTGPIDNGAAIKRIALTYCLRAETVLYEFAGHILRNRSDLNLTSQESILKVVGDAFATIIAEAREGILREFQTEEFKEMAMSHFYERSGRFLEQLQSKVRLMVSEQSE